MSVLSSRTRRRTRRMPKSSLRGVEIAPFHVGRPEARTAPASDAIPGPGLARRTALSPEVMARERPEVVRGIVEKASKVGPAFNKGGYQYVNDEEARGAKRRDR